MFRCVAMATKNCGLIRRLFGSKKTNFDSISTDDEDMAALRAFQSSSTVFTRRHTIDVETFCGETSDRALRAAASKRKRHRSEILRRYPAVFIPPTTTKPTAKPLTKPAPPRRTRSEKAFSLTAATEYSVAADDEPLKRSGSFRRRISRKDRLLRCGTFCKVDTTQPIVYPTTPEAILEYHKAMPFLDENEEWLMVELNEYECLVDGIEIIKIIANHSKFFEVEPDDLWEEFFAFVDDVPAYDEVINFDVWQEFRDKKYAC